MYENYDDIKSRITEEPTWYDQNGTPRYGRFTPSQCPNIYANVVMLVRIVCQDCKAEFLVEMHAGIFEHRQEAPPFRWHYGDPPVHGCIGDTMNCEDLEVMEAWTREGVIDWARRPEFEGLIDA